MTITIDPVAGAADPRSVAWLAMASNEVATAWASLRSAVLTGPGPMDLAAGDRPSADVEVLAGAAATCEYLLAVHMHSATSAGCLALGERGGLLSARGWSPALARRLARCAALAATQPGIAAAWSAGTITSEHVDPIARAADRFTEEELRAVVAELGPHWGAWSPASIARFVAAAERLLHPPPDPGPEELDAYATRDLSFSVTRDAVLVAACLPRVEGELVIAAIDALAERLRSAADHVPAGTRRADALVQLVNEAHSRQGLPSRGGLPVSLTVTLETTALGDPVWSTSRGHLLTEAESRWVSCDAAITPVLVEPSSGTCPDARIPGPAVGAGDAARGPTPVATPAQRIAALAGTLFDARIPLAVGRTARVATPALRRAMALRDRGCVIPGCTVAPEACQAHHLIEWADGGATDLDNCVLLCWAHHRQVDLQMWRIAPAGDTSPAQVPESGAPTGTPWPANNGAPFVVTRTPRSRWRC